MCERTYTNNLQRHVREAHAALWTCARCRATFNRQDNFAYHERSCEFRATGKRPAVNQVGEGAPKRQRALNNATDEYTINLEEREQTPESIMGVLKDGVGDLKETVERELEQKRALKITVALHVIFRQSADPSFLTEPPAVFNTSPVEVLAATDIDEALDAIREQLLKKIEEFEERGSG